MADSKRESREVDFVSCNDMDYCCSGKCAKGKDVLPKEHEKESSEITVTVTADVGDAITGFKSLQRELRATTKAARELEQAYKDVERVINGAKE